MHHCVALGFDKASMYICALKNEIFIPVIYILSYDAPMDDHVVR